MEQLKQWEEVIEGQGLEEDMEIMKIRPESIKNKNQNISEIKKGA